MTLGRKGEFIVNLTEKRNEMKNTSLFSLFSTKSQICPSVSNQIFVKKITGNRVAFDRFKQQIQNAAARNAQTIDPLSRQTF